MGATKLINLIVNCEDQENASHFRYMPLARANVGRHGHSRGTLAISCDRNDTYFWNHSARWGHIDFGFTFNGADIPGRAGYKTCEEVSPLGLGRLHHTSYDRLVYVGRGSHEDVRLYGLADY